MLIAEIRFELVCLLHCRSNKLKIIAPKWNNGFELIDACYSVSDIHDYIDYIIKKQETLSTNSLINIYIDRINNRFVFELNDGYKLEHQTSETMKLFRTTKN